MKYLAGITVSLALLVAVTAIGFGVARANGDDHYFQALKQYFNGQISQAQLNQVINSHLNVDLNEGASAQSNNNPDPTPEPTPDPTPGPSNQGEGEEDRLPVTDPEPEKAALQNGNSNTNSGSRFPRWQDVNWDSVAPAGGVNFPGPPPWSIPAGFPYSPDVCVKHIFGTATQPNIYPYRQSRVNPGYNEADCAAERQRQRDAQTIWRIENGEEIWRADIKARIDAANAAKAARQAAWGQRPGFCEVRSKLVVKGTNDQGEPNHWTVVRDVWHLYPNTHFSPFLDASGNPIDKIFNNPKRFYKQELVYDAEAHYNADPSTYVDPNSANGVYTLDKAGTNKCLLGQAIGSLP